MHAGTPSSQSSSSSMLSSISGSSSSSTRSYTTARCLPEGTQATPLHPLTAKGPCTCPYELLRCLAVSGTSHTAPSFRHACRKQRIKSDQTKGLCICLYELMRCLVLSSTSHTAPSFRHACRKQHIKSAQSRVLCTCEPHTAGHWCSSNAHLSVWHTTHRPILQACLQKTTQIISDQIRSKPLYLPA